jgi:hypothetical protein
VSSATKSVDEVSARDRPASAVAFAEAEGEEDVGNEPEGGVALMTGASGGVGVALGSQPTTRLEAHTRRRIERGRGRIAQSVAHSPILYRSNAQWDTIRGW